MILNSQEVQIQPELLFVRLQDVPAMSRQLTQYVNWTEKTIIFSQK